MNQRDHFIATYALHGIIAGAVVVVQSNHRLSVRWQAIKTSLMLDFVSYLSGCGYMLVSENRYPINQKLLSPSFIKIRLARLVWMIFLALSPLLFLSHRKFIP